MWYRERSLCVSDDIAGAFQRKIPLIDCRRPVLNILTRPESRAPHSILYTLFPSKNDHRQRLDIDFKHIRTYYNLLVMSHFNINLDLVWARESNVTAQFIYRLTIDNSTLMLIAQHEL